MKIALRAFVQFAIVAGAAIGIVVLFNINGWRARLKARFVRVENWPIVVTQPVNFQPIVPPEFRVSVFAKGFVGPRWLAVSTNSDVFVADSSAGQVVVLHGLSADGSAESRFVFADHINLPFGIAFHEDYVYVAATNEVLRFRYDPQSSRRLGNAEHILELPSLGYNQHWTRSLAFGDNGRKLFVSVGSGTNVSIERDPRRAAILVSDPDGENMRVFASGLRNAVGIGCSDQSGDLWASVNERDDLGDDIPSDYFTRVRDHGFYSWPYGYGKRQTDGRASARPDLVATMIEPDALLGAHLAPLQFAFYEKQEFPTEYWHGAFIAEHGSWNRRVRSGYQVVFIPFRDGMPSGDPKPFFHGFVPNPAGKEVYGRVVGVAVAADAALLISDDGGRVIWRVFLKKKRP